ncbi:hypothetical protein RhiirB3_510599 [Rhizophagus irregularis]|nr:hypothetical protein RhiirB3_510599 [Rhizophagus irregularis]
MGRWYSQCAGNFPCGLSEAKEIAHSRGAELKCMCTEVLRANGEYNERRDAENAKLKATIEELKSENAEFRDRLAKVEQKQMLNDNTPNNNSSNFNLVAVPGAIMVPTEEKEMDNFLLKAHKKIVSSEIKRHNKEKKLHAESVASSEQEVVKQSCQNSHKKKGVEKIAQVIIDGIQDDVKHREPISSGCSLCELFHETEISATAHRPKCSSSLLDLAKLFDKVSDAEYRTNKKANEKEILCWVNFGKEFMVHFSELVENSNGKIGEKKAKGEILDDQSNAMEAVLAEIPDDSNDDGYGGYNEYGERDRVSMKKMGQTHPKPEPESHSKHSKPNIDELRRNWFTNLLPTPRTYTDDFWSKGNGLWCFDDRDIEALNQFRQLELESLELDDEKESKIKEFCAKYNYARIPLDIDKDGYMRGFLILELTTYCIDEEELKKFGETLIVCIGNEDFYCAQIYLGGSGELYILLDDEPLKVLYNYKDTGIRSSDLFQNTNY